MDITLFTGCKTCDEQECVDIGVSCGDLIRGNDLGNAITMCLFTDRRARKDDIIPDGTDPRGWWGHALDGVEFGSRLWLLERARDVPLTYQQADEYAVEALAVLKSYGVAKKIDVKADVDSSCGCKNTLALRIQITQPDAKTLAWRYRYTWDLRQVQSCEKIENWCN